MEKIIRLDPKCVSCLLSKNLTAYPEDTPQEKSVAYMQRLLRLIADAPASWGAPVLVSEIKRLRGEMFGVQEDFEAVKAHFNRMMLARESAIERRILASDDPLKTAVAYAMIGNYIDFGALKSVEEEDLNALIENPGAFMPDEAEYAALRAEILRMRSLVFLTDNCGEIVFDKLLLREIRRLNPSAGVTVVVRGGPVLNDATEKDAKDVGLDRIAAVIGNGNDIAGTHLDALSPQAKAAVDSADLIIAKGQANHETMRYCGLNVFYMFLCKCDLFAQRFGVKKFSGVLIHDSRC